VCRKKKGNLQLIDINFLMDNMALVLVCISA
jgi:hypothetical protein